MKYNKEDFRCEFCNTEQETLYDGWFRNPHHNQEFFKGTATSGLIKRMMVCMQCAKKLIENGTACATEMPK